MRINKKTYIYCIIQLVFFCIIANNIIHAESVSKNPFISEIDKIEMKKYQKKEEQKKRKQEQKKLKEEAKRIKEELERKKRQKKRTVKKVNVKKETKKVEIILPEMQIQGVVWDVNSPTVIINNKMYSIKDKLAGRIKVMDITREEIVLLYKGKIFRKNVSEGSENNKGNNEEDGSYINFSVI